MESQKQNVYSDKIQGSLIGGAAGDALGYAVEFMSEEQILDEYGEKGITEYDLINGIARISDDTQMTLFTANAILVGETGFYMRGTGDDPAEYAKMSYLDWLTTQMYPYEEGNRIGRPEGRQGISWLLDVPELYSRRAPGNTCISSLLTLQREGLAGSIENPLNESKGCGGIMRIAPLGLHYYLGQATIDPEETTDDTARQEASALTALESLDRKGAEISAITHGASLGYMPSAVLTHILNRLVYPVRENMSLQDIVLEARDTVKRLFERDRNINKLIRIIDKAVELSENGKSDSENIMNLGGGWVAEETLAIAIYCSLRYRDDFSKGIIAAVNHSGDSDSTGAVTGNILGALLGYEQIDAKWKENLELKDVILEMAQDLSCGCGFGENAYFEDREWMRKYAYMHRRKEKF